METDSNFFINIIGQIESCSYPYGAGVSASLFCRYEITAGPDWQLVSGATNGVTQSSATNKRGQVVFNMPIEVMYKSTNPYGCMRLFYSINKFTIKFKYLFSQGPKLRSAFLAVTDGALRLSRVMPVCMSL